MTYSISNDDDFKNTLLQHVVNRYEVLLELFNSSCPAIMLSSALIMKAIVEESSSSIASKMQDSALSQGLLLKHFYNSLFSPIEDQRYVSRYLVSIWMQGHQASMRLLSRMVPEGMRNFLNEKPLTTEEIQDYINQEKLEFTDEEQISSTSTQSWMREKIQQIVNTRQNPKEQNFMLFFFQLLKEHSRADNIWNKTTLAELRAALEAELALLEQEGRGKKTSWNHIEFSVEYSSLGKNVVNFSK